MAILNLNITNQKINNSEQLILYSEVNTKKEKITYQYAINKRLQSFYKNNFNLEKNINALKKLIDQYKDKICLMYLSKGSKKIRALNNNEDKIKITNACIVIRLKELVNGYNTISFILDIEINKDQQDKILFSLKRIEFLENYEENNFIEFNFGIDFFIISNDILIPTIFYDIESLIEKQESIMGTDDYENDPLKLDKWYDLFSILYKIYDLKKINDNQDNEFFCWNKKLYLASKINFDFNSDFILNENGSERSIKTIKGTSLGKEFIIEKIPKEKNSSENKINDLESSRNDWLTQITEKKDILQDNKNIQEINIKKINEIEESIDDFKNNISNINNKLEQLENLQINYKNTIRKNEELIKKDLKENKNEVNIKDLNFEINELNKKINNFNNEKILLKDNIEQFNNQLKELELTLKDKNNEKNLYDEKINNLENEINEIKKRINQKDKEIDFHKGLINYYQIFIQNFNKYQYFYEINKFKFKNDDEESEKFNDDKQHLINNVYDLTGECENRSWSLITNDLAKRIKMTRYYHAINQLNQGYYKNYLLYRSIKNPSKIYYKKEINPIIKQKYQLNKKQELAVLKSINNTNIFYLQGPPGTGKTQTLCAISESFNLENKNVVMCSSTHEAINNFLERLHDFNKNNPNIIIYKYRFSQNENNNKKEAELFNQEKLFRNFKNAIYENFSVNQFNKVNEYIQKYGGNKPNIFDRTKWLFSILELNLLKDNLTLLNNNQEILKGKDNEFIKQFSDCYKKDIDLNDLNEVIERTKKYIESINNQFKEQISLYEEIVQDYYKHHKLDEKIFRSDIINLIFSESNSFNSQINEKMNDVKNYFKNTRIDDWESKFLKFIFDNEYINVIGITTTSRNTIEINGETKHLFDDYNVDVLLIDEISKSCTPEIISKIILSKNIVLSGDYMQLAPTPEFIDDQDIDKIILKLNENNIEFNEKNQLVKQWKCNLKKDEIKKDIEELFKTSLFKIQVNKIKNSSSSADEKSYEFLKESRRFSNNILNIVNILYDDQEKLVCVPLNRNEYILKLSSNHFLDNDVVIIDTSNYNIDYFKEYHNIKNDIDDWTDFDQSGEPFSLIGDKNNLSILIANSLYNQYNALVIIDTIKSLINNNPNKFDVGHRIGVICLTKSQKNIVKYYINHFINKEYIKFIKVDTIDNFQGREEEIIIVDFIRAKNKVDNQKFQKLDQSKRNISFLSEIERINVAISRAKAKLILVGAFSSYLNGIRINGIGNLFQKYYDACKHSDDSYISFKGEVNEN